MPTLYVMVGLPRSGKSTYVATHFPDIVKVSADQLRLIIHGKRYWARGEGRVWFVRGIMLQALLEQGLDIVIDETNTTRERRAPILRLGKEHGYTAVAVVYTTDTGTCKERAIATGQEDLIPVIESMASCYEEVTAEEGFDDIVYVTKP